MFEDALRAVAELLGDARPEAASSRRLEVEARDRPALLAAWVDELIFLAETEGLVPDRVEELDLQEDRLEAVVAGHRGEPSHLVKGATYHRIGFDCGRDGCRATVVLDV